MLMLNCRSPVRLSLPPLLFDRLMFEFQTQDEWLLNPEGYFAKENLSDGEPRVHSAGIELELPIVSEFDATPGDASTVICAHSDRFAYEFCKAVVESISDPEIVSPDILANMAKFYYDSWVKAQVVLDGCETGHILLGIGYYPDFAQNPSAQLSLMTRRKARYSYIMNSLVSRNGPISLKGKDIDGRDVTILTDGGSYVPGLSCGEHLNFVTNRPGSAANAAVILSAPLVYLGANSPFLRGFGDDSALFRYGSRWILCAKLHSRSCVKQ